MAARDLQAVSSALFLSPQVAFLPTCPHCTLPVHTSPAALPADNTSDAHATGPGPGSGPAPAPDAVEPNLDAWVTTHLACLPHLTELLAFVQEPEGGDSGCGQLARLAVGGEQGAVGEDAGGMGAAL